MEAMPRLMPATCHSLTAGFARRFLALLPPTHPGAILREDVLPAIGEPVMKVAKQLGVTRQHLHRILAEKAPVTPEMALRLGEFCGNGPDLWLRMQQAYDLRHAGRALGAEIRKIPPAKAGAV
jgi:addiction module HigA family antidote